MVEYFFCVYLRVIVEKHRGQTDKLCDKRDATIHVSTCSVAHGRITILTTTFGIVQVVSKLIWHFVCMTEISDGREKHTYTRTKNVVLRMLIHEKVFKPVANDNRSKVQDVMRKNYVKIIFYFNFLKSTNLHLQIVVRPSSCFNCVKLFFHLISV